LVVFRFLQGAGAAVMVPQIVSVIQMRFTGAARAKALSAYGLVLSVGSVAGLVFGGLLVNANLFGATWRPAFLVNVPIGVLLTVLVSRLVPADEPRATRRLDFAGLAVATSGVFLIVLPLVLGHELGWPAWCFLSIAVGLVLAAVFVPLERRIAARGGDPLLNLAVLRAPGIGSGISTLTFTNIAYGGFLFVFTLHLETGLGDGALRVGLTYIPFSATFGLLGFFWRKLPARLHHALGPVGLAVCALGYLGTALAMRSGGQGSPLMWTALVVMGAGFGLAVTPVLTQSLMRVPLARAADASGVLTTTAQLNQVIGVTVFGTLFLSLRQTATSARAQASAEALSTTTLWLTLLFLLGIASGIVLSRTVRNAHTQQEKGQTSSPK
jgi:hypothetical protein